MSIHEQYIYIIIYYLLNDSENWAPKTCEKSGKCLANDHLDHLDLETCIGFFRQALPPKLQTLIVNLAGCSITDRGVLRWTVGPVGWGG